MLEQQRSLPRLPPHPLPHPLTLLHHLQGLGLVEAGVPELVKQRQHKVGACGGQGPRRRPPWIKLRASLLLTDNTSRHKSCSRPAALLPAPAAPPAPLLTVSGAADVHLVQRGEVVAPVERGAGVLVKPSHQQVCLVGGLQQQQQWWGGGRGTRHPNPRSGAEGVLHNRPLPPATRTFLRAAASSPRV